MATTYGERLKTALEYRSITQRAFIEHIKNKGITRGISYRSLANYLTNEFTPTQPWTQAAAAILGVSETWLGADEGQMLPNEVTENQGDPNIDLCLSALNYLGPQLAKTRHLATLVHLMLARDRFQEVYGDTKGLKSAKAKKSYAKHLLLPLETLLLHVRGSSRFGDDVGHEVVRAAISQYLELVLLLMPPSPEAASDEARKGVSTRLAQWKKELEGSIEYAVGKHIEADPKPEEV